MVWQFSRFAGVGLLATLLHVATALIAEALIAAPPQGANLIGFFAAVCLSYFGHSYFTFGTTGNHDFHMPRFVCIALAGLAVSSAITYLVCTRFGMPFALAMAIVAVTVPPLTFLAAKSWAFAEQDTPPAGVSGLLIAVIVSVAFFAVFQGRSINHDTAWYLVATRKWLDGARLYVDLIEVNPPLTFYLTAPAIWLADAVAISDRTAQYALVAGLLATSLIWIWALISRADWLSLRHRQFALIGVALALVVPAAGNVAQREHLMLIFLMPYLFGFVILPEPDCGRGALARAAFAAVGLCIKPHFMIFPLAFTLVLIGRRRSLKPVLSPTNLLFLAFGSIYVALVAVLHPEYLDKIVPLAAKVYGAYGLNSDYLIANIRPATVLLFGVLVLIILRRRAFVPGIAILGTAVLAAIAIYLLQWTGYEYQSMPIQTLAAVSFVWILVQPQSLPLVQLLAGTGIVLVLASSFKIGMYQNPAGETVAGLLPGMESGTRLMVVSSSLGPSFPLVLEAHAIWTSRYPALWPIPGAVYWLEHTDCETDGDRCRALERVLDETRANVVTDIETGQPDVMIFDFRLGYFEHFGFDFQRFLAEDPRFDGLMADYRLDRTTPGFSVWKRRETALAPASR